MKLVRKAAVIVYSMIAVSLAGCKKTDIIVPPVNPPVNPPGGSVAHKPNFICEHQPSNRRLNGEMVIFDLNQDLNKDKQYFVVSLIPSGSTTFTDSAAVILTPRSIDSMGTNWPAQIKSAAFGVSSNILVDAKNAISHSAAGDPWNYAAINTTSNLYRKLNDASYASTKAGQKPYGSSIYSPNYFPRTTYTDYPRLYREITYYFKDALFTENIPNGGLKSLDTLFPGANAIPWTNIDQSVSVDFEVSTTNLRYYRKYFYFDWTNWKYYVVTETEARQNYLSYAPVYYVVWDVKSYSLNSFCKWPSGWQR